MLEALDFLMAIPSRGVPELIIAWGILLPLLADSPFWIYEKFRDYYRRCTFWYHPATMSIFPAEDLSLDFT